MDAVKYSETAKHQKYEAHTRDSRRVLEGQLFAAACSTAGKVGDEFKRAAEILEARTPPGFLQLSLVRLHSYCAVIESASSILEAFQPGVRGTQVPTERTTEVPRLAIMPALPREPAHPHPPAPTRVAFGL